MNWTALVAGAVSSVVTGLAVWFVTWSRARIDEKRRMKRELLTEVMGNRYDLRGDSFSRALNAAAVMFADSANVKNAIREFHAGVTAENRNPLHDQEALLAMIRTMFADLKLPHGDLSDEFLLRPFNTRADSTVPPVRPMHAVSPEQVGDRPRFKPQGFPALSGGGQNSYSCPSCGVMLLAQVPAQMELGVVIECPQCGQLNDLR